jgi:hypothetical protein
MRYESSIQLLINSSALREVIGGSLQGTHIRPYPLYHCFAVAIKTSAEMNLSFNNNYIIMELSVNSFFKYVS